MEAIRGNNSPLLRILYLMDKVNLSQKFARFSESWSPKIVGEVNDSYVKLVKFAGEFVWHHHDLEDELFYVIQGTLRMKYREADGEREIAVHPGEFVIVPRGTEHMPIADEEVHVMLLEPKSTLNTATSKRSRSWSGSDVRVHLLPRDLVRDRNPRRSVACREGCTGDGAQ